MSLTEKDAELLKDKISKSLAKTVVDLLKPIYRYLEKLNDRVEKLEQGLNQDDIVAIQHGYNELAKDNERLRGQLDRMERRYLDQLTLIQTRLLEIDNATIESSRESRQSITNPWPYL